ncbi:prolyl aminopeptidase [Flavobacterium sp. GA093]|uniref:Proline iminopeptidase n=1 Tax=Flavobacterium hydrocarbonoxydans TaxID=2683249 RepID=A0A6I4NZ28_9FLAO|nr:prolyl aminopeptidase [Flavobacterium hydrocarbonoxydans]MWB96297.1 prolyl aminopeptidase [Flavobacterium hydrocarbonoxydans]
MQEYKIQKGYLQVSELHNIYYEVCGNDAAEPYLFVHGGPGAGFSEHDKRFFDFDKHKVIFFDQRGASKSEPFGEIKENTTQDLVNDINTLLLHLNIDKMAVFGGSWGTTLSLVFAIQNPDKIKSLLLRGIFLGNNSAIDHYLNGGVEKEFPNEWKRFKQNVPLDTPQTIAEYYLDQMLHGTPESKAFYCYEWAFYELSIFKKGITKPEIELLLTEFPYESLAIMEAHYLSNACFIDEDYILNNIEAIKEIPTAIIHGQSDAICPVTDAIALHNNLNNSVLYIEDAGHSDSETAIENRIMKILSN